MRISIFQVAILLCGFLSCVSSSCMTNVFVDSLNGVDSLSSGSSGSPFATIMFALNTADICDSAVVSVASGTYEFNLPPTFNDITIVASSGPSSTFLDDSSFPIEFNAAGTYSLDGFTIGAAQFLDTTVSLKNCIFQGNDQSLNITGGSARITNCQFLDNTNAAVRVFGSAVLFEECIFSNNSFSLTDTQADCLISYFDEYQNEPVTVCGGGAIAAIDSEISLINSHFLDNYVAYLREFIPGESFAIYGGSVLLFRGTKILVDSCLFQGSYIQEQGTWGSLESDTMYISVSENAVIQNSIFSHRAANSLFSGGNVAVHGTENGAPSVLISNVSVTDLTITAFTFKEVDTVEILHSNFTNISSELSAGGIECSATSLLSIRNCIVSFVEGAFLVNNEAILNITECTFFNNTAIDLIVSNAAYSSIENSIFMFNTGRVNSEKSGTTPRGGSVGDDDEPVAQTMRITNCLFESSIGQPAVFGRGEYLVAEHCIFRNNLGYSAGAAVVIVESEALIDNCTFTNNSAQYGAGVTLDSSLSSGLPVTISNCYFYGNTAVYGGAVYAGANNMLQISHSTFHSNAAAAFGGGLHSQDSSISIEWCSFLDNKGEGNGGAIYFSADSVDNAFDMTINGSVFIRNSASGPNAAGGAIYSTTSSIFWANSVSIFGSEFYFCSATNGGAMGVGSPDVNKNSLGISSVFLLSNCTMKENNSTSNGGSLYASHLTEVQVIDSVFLSSNSDQQGGAIYAEGTNFKMNNSLISNCSSNFNGGAISIISNENLGFSVYRFGNVTFQHNKAILGAGGALSISTSASVPVFLSECQIVENDALSFGGAIYVTTYSRPNILGTTLRHNKANQGGGIYAEVQARPSLSLCNLTENQALSDGGAASFSGFASPSFIGVVFTGNSAGNGGAVSSTAQSNASFAACLFTENTSELGKGGAVFTTTTTTGAPRFSECIFGSNTALYGGAFAAVTSSAQFVNCQMKGNSGLLQGGAVHLTGASNPRFQKSALYQNSAPSGGGLYCEGLSSFKMSEGKVASNSAEQGGGINANGQCTPDISSSSFSGNSASDSGGAVFVLGSLFSLSANNFTNNTAATNGGGIYLNSGMNSTSIFGSNSFQKCHAGNAGGGVFWDRDAFNHDHKQTPICTACSNSGNSASYGDDIATEPIAALFDVTPSALEVLNGAIGPFQIRVVDFYNQTILGASTLRVRVAIVNTTNDVTRPLISGITEELVSNGTATFSQIEINGLFGRNYSLLFSVSGDSLGDVPTLRINVTYSGCTSGQEGITTSQQYQTCKSCSSGSYNLNGNGTCMTCPSNAVCGGGTSIIAKNNYWLYVENGLAETHNCPEGFCENGGCANRRGGILCGTCEPGYQSSYSNCIKCDKPYDPKTLFGDIILLWLFVVLLQYSAKLPSQQAGFEHRYIISGLTKIIFFFLQTVVLVSTPGENLQRLFSFFNFQFFFALGQQCSIKLDFFGDFLLSVLMPLILFGILIVNLALQLAIHLVTSKLSSKQPHLGKLAEYSKVNFTTYIRAVCSMVLFSYSQVTQAVFTFLNCRDIGPHRVVASAPDVSCNSSTYKHWSVFAYFLLFTYVVCLPIALFVVLLKYHYNKKLYQKFFSKKFGIFYQCFKDKNYYWEVVILVRRLLFIMIYVLAFSVPSAKNLALFIFALLVLILHLLVNPFFSKIENIIESALLSILAMLAGIQSAGASDVFPDETSVFSAVITFLAIIPIAIGVYCLVQDILLRMGVIKSKVIFPHHVQDIPMKSTSTTKTMKVHVTDTVPHDSESENL